MGLDMYLYRRIREPENENIGYWRKANAIHAWFVDNVQGGTDACQESYVPQDELSYLLEVVNEVLVDHSKAEELLPVRQGFFFGSDEYDDGYFSDLKNTKEILVRALCLPSDSDIYYRSSW